MNKKLLQSVREYKKQSIIAPLLVTLEVLMEVLIPLEMAKIIDIGIAGGNLGYIVQRGLILVIMAMMSLFFGVQAGNFAAIAGAGYAKNLRHDIYYKVQDFSFKNIDHFSTSGLVTRMTTDITNIQMAYMMSIRLLARAPIMIVLSWIMTLTLSKKAALLFLIVIPVLGGTLLFIAKKAHPHFIKVFDEYDDLNNSVQENVNAARVVKAFVREDYEIDKFHGVSKYVYQLFTTAEKIVAWNSPVMQFVMYAVIMILVYIGGKGIVAKTMETGALTSIIVYALQIIGSLMMVTFVFVMIMIAGASTDRITEVLDEIPEMIDPADAVTSVADGDIVFDHVSFSYAGEGGNLSLKDVNLHIKSGQTVGIIGGTGSAKSTLVQLIPRLYDVTKGSVMVGGVDVRKYNLEALRDQVSMVLQKNVLFSGTIYDNIRWGNENASDEEVQNVCKLAQADGFVREFPDGYNTQIVQGGNNVSGGQKQRLCIARALLKKPKILILDDSTSAVDTKTDALIRKAFREEIPNTTKIIIAQRVSSIEDADQIIVLENGVDVRKYNLEALRDQVSMVLQKNVLFSGTIYDNIRWGNENASDEEVQNVCKLAQADGFVREFPDGYNTQIVQGGNNVSGGQKQRLCIARALLKKPKILILDDSTSAVDTKTDALIRKAFREEIPNTTKIIIAQRVSSIEDADQIIVLENGAISGIGTSEELLKTNDIYREVYESQVKGGEDHE